MASLNQKILLSIECPTCLEYMTSPIYVCVTGHSICGDCWKNLDSCPMCKLDLSETRNYSLETLANFLSYPCHNSDYGCKKTMKLSEMEDHLQVCSFRARKCKIHSCGWEGRMSGLKDHFHNSHREWLISAENWSMHEILHDRVFLMLAHQEIFYVHMNIVKNCMYWVVQHIGKSEDVVKYTFQIRIFARQKRQITAMEICQDDTKDDITEIIDSGYVVGVPIPVLETYKNRRNQIWCHISIKKA